MNKLQVIAYLRQNCIVQDPTGTTAIDPAFLALTDTELDLTLQVALSKEYPQGSVDNIPADYLYPTILVAKKELYFQLSSKTAPLYPISLGEDGSIKKNIRFDHYMTLITNTEKEYQNFKSTGTPVIVGQAVLNDWRYFTKQNYNLATPPTCSLVADTVGRDHVELSWSANNITRFYSFVLYKSTESIIDIYVDPPIIIAKAEKIKEFYDIHTLRYRVTGLTPNTLNYITLVTQESNGLKGYSEVSFTTLV